MGSSSSTDNQALVGIMLSKVSKQAKNGEKISQNHFVACQNSHAV
jgi:hypothetical protein